VAWEAHAQTNYNMKNFTLSLEALLLIFLLLAGLYGARTIMKGDDVSPGLASPRQEEPAMVMASETNEDAYEMDQVQ
jgi:hypothetical protein